MTRIGDWLRAVVGPAFVKERRDLTDEGRTKPDYVRDVGDMGPGRVVVVIPAHNEALLIGEALESLAAQTRIADEVMVVVDRCSDETAQIAAVHGAASRLTILNRDNKAGALNQALAALLPRLSDNDAVLVMDADTSLSPRFISEATWRLREANRRRAQVGAVGGVFLGYPVHGFLANIQNNEYVRYAREIHRRKGRADVLTGTATLFSVRVLREVANARSSGRLPPTAGVYGVDALTEDNELTLAVKHLGYRCVSPKACTVGTELMPTSARLFSQRLRWQRGALQNLAEYGVTRITSPYMVRQLLTYTSVAFVPFFLTTLVYVWMTTGSVGWSWFWIAVTGFVLIERAWSVKGGGWRSVLIAGLVFPEAIYDLFLHTVYLKALTDLVTHARGTWDSSAPVGSLGTRPRLQLAHFRVGLAGAAELVAVVGLAVVCAVNGWAWSVIAAFVLTGAAFAALRFSGLDPLGPLLGTGEPADIDHTADASSQGFGGGDVPEDAQARRGGEGTHHALLGAPGVRSARVTSSTAARRSRQATTEWLAKSRLAEPRRFKDTWS